MHPAYLVATVWDAHSKVLTAAITIKITIFGCTTHIIIFLDPSSKEKLILGTPTISILPIQIVNEITKVDLLPKCKQFRVKTSEKACQADEEDAECSSSAKICKFSTNPTIENPVLPIITPR